MQFVALNTNDSQNLYVQPFLFGVIDSNFSSTSYLYMHVKQIFQTYQRKIRTSGLAS